MTSTVTLWTSTITKNVESQVARLVRSTGDLASVYDSVSCVGCSVAETTKKLNDSFHRLVTMTMADSTLHVVAIIPLFENSALQQIRTVYEACSQLEHGKTLHIFGLCDGIRRILDSKESSGEDTGVDAVALLKNLSSDTSFSFSYSLIDDYAANGAPIGFTINSLSRYLALIMSGLIQNYYSILAPSLLAAHSGKNLSIGVASLSFDRVQAENRLLGLGFLSALDKYGINSKEVDLQKAAHEAECLLAGITQRYSNLFEKSIRPLYKDKGMDEGKAVAEASDIINNDLDGLKTDVLSLLDREDLTLPEKEAVLAMILGRDNENLRGMQYQHDGILLDDACNESINLYVEAFNRCCPKSRLLPIRGDFEALKKYVWNDSRRTYEDSDANSLAINPIPELKKLKQQIINTTAFIRERTDELVELQKSSELRDDAEEIKRRWHRPTGNLKSVEFKEQPLDDKYIPAPETIAKQTVDLRKYFSPVRNQAHLGSCTSFAIVSMYEAMMNKNNVEGENIMSPAFLYYYSNILTGRPAGGSNFYEQLEVLGQHGVCYNSLYCYDADSPADEPSSHAKEDALTHRVISAKQIPLVDGYDKADSIKRNHQILTSALSEGYPVGISLKIYDNFGKEGAFILHPEDARDAKEDGWHAMVIVGYSQDNNFYIVRNSWGMEFGEEGYCYVPTAYIDDPEYMDFACIITEISDMANEGNPEIPTALANFAATESEIRIATIRNAITGIRVELKNNQKLYSEYYKYYQRLVLQLTMPNVQNSIRREAEVAQAGHYINVDKKRQELEDTFVKKLKEYKKYLSNVILILLTVTLSLAITWYFSSANLVGIFALICAGLCGACWGSYKWWVRLKRRQLQEELDETAVDAKRQVMVLLEMQIKFHVAGMWITRFHKLSTKIGGVYDRLVSFNDTLRAWQNNYSLHLNEADIIEGQMFRKIGTSLLGQFFEANKDQIVCKIDLLKVFSEYQATMENLEHAHEKLQESITEVINKLFEDFSIGNYLMGNEYPYAETVNLSDEIAALIAVGQPCFRNKAMNATPPIRMIMAKIDPAVRSIWESRINPYFPLHPIQLMSADPTTLLLITLQPHDIYE